MAISKVFAVKAMIKDILLIQLMDENDELAKHMEEKFGDSQSYGTAKGLLGEANYNLKASREYTQANAALQEQLTRFNSSSTTPVGRLQDLANTYDLSEFAEYDFVEVDRAGKYRFNPEKFYDWVSSGGDDNLGVESTIIPPDPMMTQIHLTTAVTNQRKMV